MTFEELDILSRRKRDEAQERGQDLKCVYIGYDLKREFDLWKENQPFFSFPYRDEDIIKLYEEGPSFAYNGINYFIVTVKEHLEFLIV